MRSRCLLVIALAITLLLLRFAPSSSLAVDPVAGPRPAEPPGELLLASAMDGSGPLWVGPLQSLPKAQTTRHPGADEPVQVIIQFDGDSVALHKRRLRASPLELTEAEKDRVRAYQSALQESHQRMVLQFDELGIAVEVRREYTYIFNGLAVWLQAVDLERVAALPGVRAVHPDREVHALLEDSVALIGADQVWTMLDPSGQPVTGRGIRVAVLDTGIDYTHPDLGGGFGPGYKVVDGYDFVSDDADPMDYNGHGTHCAGIVAANGTVKGVAPDAILLAYKVLNVGGSGRDSDIIAAIERATNPDDDPATDDAVDVISMSLGGYGSPDDAGSLAVDAAVEQGVVVVVAAGNGGEEYETLTSPGVARQAFTVGASDKVDAMAEFSSRGPVPGFHELIKPDIVAPGVQVTSTYLAGEYFSLEGTSMSTPHIAGCAALIKQLHPSWSPEMIQANLMNTAKDLGGNVFTHGAGRVQVRDAARAPAVLSPGSIGFGAVDATQPLWTKSEQLLLSNVGTSALDYSLSVSGTLPAGITSHLEPAAGTLGAGQSVTATFAVTVDNHTTPYQNQEPGSYEGQLLAQVAAQSQAQVGPDPVSLTVPFAMLKPVVRAPRLISPPSGRLTDDPVVHFVWEDVASAAQYRIQVDSSDAFTSPNLISDTVTDETYTVTLDKAMWYWHVLAIDAEGTESAYSNWSLVTVADPPVRVTADPGADVQPSMVQAADGVLWVAWTSDRSGNEDVWYSASSDGGATWSGAAQLTAHPNRDWDAAISQSADGTLFLMWVSDRSGNHDLWFKTSSDRGATWSADTQLTTHPGEDVQPATIGTLDGNLWVVWVSDRSGNRDIWYVKSGDGGAVWSTATQLTTHSASDRDPDITQAPDGTLWVVWESERTIVPFWCKVSRDGGATWATAANFEGSRLDADQPAIVATGNGTVMLTWHFYYRFDKYRSGSEVLYSTSTDSGTTWTWPWRWTRYMGYNDHPGLARLNNGAAAVVWDSGRWLNRDVWFGVVGQHADLNPPPYVDDVFNDAGSIVYSDQVSAIGAYVDDEAGPESVHLVWRRGGSPQPDVEMYDDGTHGDRLDHDRWWHVQIGPFPAGTHITYQVRAVDFDGNAVTAPLTPGSITVLERPTPTPTPSSQEDTYIYRWTPDHNYCSEDTLTVGYRQQYAALLRFDLSHIPSNAIVTYARLELWATGWDDSNMDIEAYGILRDTELCQATWNQAQAGHPWDAPGCEAPGSDRLAQRETSVRTRGLTKLAFNVTNLAQQWVSGRLANNGLLLRGASALSPSLFEFASTEHSDTNLRPRLLVYHETPGGPTATLTTTPTTTPTATSTSTSTPTPTAMSTATATATPSPTPTRTPANSPPTVGPVSPSSGRFRTVGTYYFTTLHRDPDGQRDVRRCHFLIAASRDASNAMYLYYNAVTNQLYLRSDNGNRWWGGYAPGTAHTISNAQGKLNCQKTRVTKTGNTITIRWAVMFKRSYTGRKRLFVRAVDIAGLSTGWKRKGTVRIIR